MNRKGQKLSDHEKIRRIRFYAYNEALDSQKKVALIQKTLEQTTWE